MVGVSISDPLLTCSVAPLVGIMPAGVLSLTSIRKFEGRVLT